MQTHAALMTALYRIQAIQFGEFKLKSGLTSSIYINLRKIISYPRLLRQIAAAMWEQVHEERFDLVCGVPYTALPLATCVSLEHEVPMVMRRKEKKEYGTKQVIEGEFQPGQTCLVLEDLITTGSSIVETAQDLEAAGLKVQAVVALIDREQGGKAQLAARYKVYTLFRLSEMLHTLLAAAETTQAEKMAIEQFLAARSIS